MKEKILVADDEKEIAELLTLYLENEGYEVFCAYDGKQALEIVNTQKIDLALLDIMMPQIDGIALCTQIRKHYKFPILFVTARQGSESMIEGLLLGGDDYITKPFQPLVVMARVKGQLRRYHNYEENTSCIQIRDLCIDENAHTASLQGEVLNLAPIEFNLLLELAKNKGKVMSSEVLFERVWKENYFNSNNTVMVHIRRLREKMHEDSKNPSYIKTIWGVGYCINE